MNDLFSQFADQFKPKEEPQKEVNPEPIQEPIVVKECRLVDRYEVYRRANPNERISVKDFLLLEQREQGVEGLESMSEFEKKQRRLADKPKGFINDILNAPEVPYNPPLIYTLDESKENNDEESDVDIYFDSRAYQDKIDIAKEQIQKHIASMPPGLKELQKLNAVNNHDDLVVEPLAEIVTFSPKKVTKEKKIKKEEESIKVSIPTSKVRMLAIDQASNCGWATANASGVWDFTTRKDESSGMKMLRFRAKLKEVCALEDINLIVYERVAGFHKAAIIHAAKMVAIIESFAEENGIEYKAVSAKEVKKFATDNGNASKDKMVAAAQSKLGYSGTDDNEADALWIYQLVKKELAL